LDHRLVEGLMEAVAPIIMEVRETARKEIAVARNEIAELKAELEAVKALKPEKGDPGEPGKSADPVDIDAVVAKLLPLMPPPKEGASVTVDDVMPAILEAVAEKAIPGRPGKDADPVDVDLVVEKILAKIPPAKDGTSVTLEDVLPEIRKAVADEYAANPPAPGKPGERGYSGVDVKDLLIDADGQLVVTLSTGEVKRAGRVVGTDGAPGKPGENGNDGLGFEDMSEELDADGRTIIRRYSRGEKVVEFRHKFGVTLYQGVFSDDREQPYQKGDQVSYGGSMWIAQKDAPEGRPQDGNPSWKLAVKRGRDGKDGKAPPGPIGPVSVPAAKS
jgi:hypothetical protein